MDLAQVDLRDIDLSHAILNGANLERANLAGTQLCEAEMIGAKLNYAHLANANLSRAILNMASLVRANLRGADISDASLLSIMGRNANFEDAILSSSRLSDANLEYANLQRACLKKAAFSKAVLRGVNLRDAIVDGADFSFAKLQRANLYFASREHAVFVRANLGGALISTKNADLFLAAQSPGKTFRDEDFEVERIAHIRQTRAAASKTRMLKLVTGMQRFCKIAAVIGIWSIVVSLLLDVYLVATSDGAAATTGFNYPAALVIVVLAGACGVVVAHVRVLMTERMATDMDQIRSEVKGLHSLIEYEEENILSDEIATKDGAQ